MKLLLKAFIVSLLLLPILLSAESKDVLRARAQKGEAEAQFQLAEYLTEWASDSQDIREALAWYRKAAAQGHLGAIAGLGACYLDGPSSGVEQKNLVLARKYLNQSAEAGVAKGQFFLADMYKKGEGVPQDYVLAYKWLNLAAAQGYPSSTNYNSAAFFRDELAAKMTPEQVAEGQKLAREFCPNGMSFGEKMRSLFGLLRSHWMLAILGGAFLIYGIRILYCAGIGRYRSGEALTRQGTIHVLVWTLAPPIWFFLESWWDGFSELQPGQDAAGKVWAAMLVALLFLVKRS